MKPNKISRLSLSVFISLSSIAIPLMSNVAFATDGLDLVNAVPIEPVTVEQAVPVDPYAVPVDQQTYNPQPISYTGSTGTPIVINLRMHDGDYSVSSNSSTVNPSTQTQRATVSEIKDTVTSDVTVVPDPVTPISNNDTKSDDPNVPRIMEDDIVLITSDNTIKDTADMDTVLVSESTYFTEDKALKEKAADKQDVSEVTTTDSIADFNTLVTSEGVVGSTEDDLVLVTDNSIKDIEPTDLEKQSDTSAKDRYMAVISGLRAVTAEKMANTSFFFTHMTHKQKILLTEIVTMTVVLTALIVAFLLIAKKNNLLFYKNAAKVKKEEDLDTINDEMLDEAFAS